MGSLSRADQYDDHELLLAAANVQHQAATGTEDQPSKLMSADDVVQLRTARSDCEYKKVCIVGAGVTGICSCKHLLQHGIDSVVVLEREEAVGGVWRNTFATTKLQTIKDAYQFCDFPWPAGTPTYPTHRQVVDYLHSYATNFHVMERIQFRTRVVEVRRLDLHVVVNSTTQQMSSSPTDHQYLFKQQAAAPAACNWAVGFQTTGSVTASNPMQWLFCEFLVMCVGHFGDVPRLPPRCNYDPEVFRGQVLHSLDYGKLDDTAARALVLGKRVVVVGLRKSALDVAMETADANNYSGPPCTMVFRTPHWITAHDKAFGVPLGRLLRTRFSDLLVPKQGQPPLLGVLSALLTPLRWAISWFVEVHLLRTLPLRELDMVPDASATFLDEFKSCKLTLAPPNFFEACLQRRILLHRTPDWSFAPDGVRLASGDVVPADLVILCTGYEGEKKLKSILGKDLFTDLSQEQDNIIPLYRGVIPPHVPNLAIIGFQEGYSNLFNAEMSARWLGHLLSNKISLPSIGEMAKVSHRWVQYSRAFTMSNSKTCNNPMCLWQADQICRDLGWNPRRKKGVIKELFEPYSNMDYKDK